MLLTRFVSAAALGAAWISTAAGDAQFEQVRIKSLNDHSNRETDPPEKYFRMCIAFAIPNSSLRDTPR